MADEPTEQDRAAYKAALRSTNGHKLQANRALEILEQCIVNNQIENIDLVKTSLKLLETQISKIEGILDNEAGNPACPQDFILDLTNFVLGKGTIASKITNLLKKKEPAKAPTGSNLDVSNITEALTASFNKLNLRQTISTSDLPKFYGDPAEYVPFVECFNYMVHDDDTIPNAMKANT